MFKTYWQIVQPVFWHLEGGLSGSTHKMANSLLAEVKTDVGKVIKSTGSAPADTTPPLDQAINTIETHQDMLQLALTGETLPQEARRALQGLNDALNSIVKTLNANGKIAPDHEAVKAFQKHTQELENLLNPAPLERAFHDVETQLLEVHKDKHPESMATGDKPLKIKYLEAELKHSRLDYDTKQKLLNLVTTNNLSLDFVKNTFMPLMNNSWGQRLLKENLLERLQSVIDKHPGDPQMEGYLRNQTNYAMTLIKEPAFRDLGRDRCNEILDGLAGRNEEFKQGRVETVLKLAEKETEARRVP